jgi:hypothetical protein
MPSIRSVKSASFVQACERAGDPEIAAYGAKFVVPSHLFRLRNISSRGAQYTGRLREHHCEAPSGKGAYNGTSECRRQNEFEHGHLLEIAETSSLFHLQPHQRNFDLASMMPPVHSRRHNDLTAVATAAK